MILFGRPGAIWILALSAITREVPTIFFEGIGQTPGMPCTMASVERDPGQASFSSGSRTCARMRIAFDHLAKKGGQAPGPNGRRYKDLASAEVWDLCRCLAKSVREGTYRPGPEHVTWIEKSSGSGRRPIVVSNIEDRVVQRAMVEIIQPFLEPLFEPSSFGYRPKISHLHALAHAEHLAAQTKALCLARGRHS